MSLPYTVDIEWEPTSATWVAYTNDKTAVHGRARTLFNTFRYLQPGMDVAQAVRAAYDAAVTHVQVGVHLHVLVRTYTHVCEL